MSSDRIVVFASTRADLTPLTPVLSGLASAGWATTLLWAPTRDGSPAPDPPDIADVTVEAVTLPDITAGETRVMVAVAEAVAQILAQVRPHAFLVLGDRWELLGAVPPALLSRIPVVHLHGGEVTLGSIDERVRHAVTKLADLHLVSTDGARARLLQMGEEADRVVVTGAPGLDALTRRAPDAGAVDRLLGGSPIRPFGLVTYHPETIDRDHVEARARAVLDAASSTLATTIVTYPGPDPGADSVRTAIERVADRPGVHVIPTLGDLYLDVLANVDVVIGNSSSGIIEAALFGIPAVDIGRRQSGRERSLNVLHSGYDDIRETIREALSPAFRDRSREVVSPYGNGEATPRIIEALRDHLPRPDQPKVFVDAEERP